MLVKVVFLFSREITHIQTQMFFKHNLSLFLLIYVKLLCFNFLRRNVISHSLSVVRLMGVFHILALHLDCQKTVLQQLKQIQRS